MTAYVTTSVPERTELRKLYDDAIAELNPARGNRLTTPFYRQTGDAVFEAGYLALDDTVTATKRMHTVPAPAGSGKSSFSYALLIALTRYADQHPNAPYGSVLVVNEIKKADEIYRELSVYLPGRVAIWTHDHDRNCKKLERLTEEPATKFTQPELRYWPVIIVTHALYLGVNGNHARTVIREGHEGERALTVVDEKPEEAPCLEIAQSEAQLVREALVVANPDAKEPMDALLRFMEQYNSADPNKLHRPGIEIDYVMLARDLGWFRSEAGENTARANKGITGISKLFAFVRSLVAGRACIATIGVLPYFFWYEEQRVIDRSAGAILLDATADIDGVSRIVTWRVETKPPKARYDNLDIICVPQHTKTRLSEYLKTASNQRSYVKWMVNTIKEHMAPGEKGLVICKMDLFKAERVPTWNEGDPRFKEPKIYTEQYGWDIEGRSLCATHWGTGIGENYWHQADVVFLFDEFIVPRRTSVAHTQGYRGHRADQGDLGSMKTLNSKAKGVDAIAEGQILRWTKQLALRGNARNYDEHGVCGKQRLVVSGDLKRFMANVGRLFPGAKTKTIGASTDNDTWGTKALQVISSTQGSVLTTVALGENLGKSWRKISHRILTPEFERSIAGIGWRYVRLKGRLGARFERTVADLPEPPVPPFVPTFAMTNGTQGVTLGAS